MYLTNLIRASVMTKEASKWPTYDGQQLRRFDHVTSSEAYQCARMLAFRKQEEKNTVPIENFWDTLTDEQYDIMLAGFDQNNAHGLFERGHNVEAWVVERFRDMADETDQFHWIGDDQRSFHIPKYKVSGTPDGVYVDNTNDCWGIIEIKSTEHQVAQPKRGHREQTLTNAGIIEHLRRKGLLEQYTGVKLPETMGKHRLLYVSAAHYLNLNEFEIDYDNGEAMMFAAAKAKKIFDKKSELINPTKIEPEGLKGNGCYFCDFKEACADIEAGAKRMAAVAKIKQAAQARDPKTRPMMELPAFAKDMTRDDAVQYILDFDGFSKEEKHAKAQKDALRALLMPWVDELNEGEVEFEEEGLTLKALVTTSKRSGGIDVAELDKFLHKHGTDSAEFRKPDTEVKSLRITVKKAS